MMNLMSMMMIPEKSEDMISRGSGRIEPLCLSIRNADIIVFHFI